MKNASSLKIPTVVDFGTAISGNYCQAILPLLSDQPAFLTLTLNSRSLANGFFLVKTSTNQCCEELNVVLKPGKKTDIFLFCCPKEVQHSTEYKGELTINEEGIEHSVRLIARSFLPRVECKKMLQDTVTSLKMIRLVVNKAITSDVRIPLFNPEDLPLEFQVGLLAKSSIANKQNPFILKTPSTTVMAEPRKPFFVFVSVQTNIGYKGDPKGMKKVVFRNVLALTTSSSLIWCLPMEIIVVFVKQPQFKGEL